MRITKTRIIRLACSSLAALALSTCAVASAEAAQHQWVGVPAFAGASGSAIIDGYSPGYWSSRAYGRVYVYSPSGCARIQYAPYAIAAADGGWNNTTSVCGGAAYRSWSDTFHLAYHGFKFRICRSTCGSVAYIRF